MLPMVFIGDSSKDQAKADAIHSHIESAEITSWSAQQDIAVGSDWTHWIRGLKRPIHGSRKRYSELWRGEASRQVANARAVGEEAHLRCEASIAAEGGLSA